VLDLVSKKLFGPAGGSITVNLRIGQKYSAKSSWRAGIVAWIGLKDDGLPFSPYQVF